MFYSQIILAKKGPLGKVWQAAHWGDKKLGRPAIFATDISQVADSIQNPAAPLALRVSGHLLLGVVRIYSRQVKYLVDDCQQAVVKVKLAFTTTNANTSTTTTNKDGTIDITRAGGGNNKKNAQITVSNFGEYTAVDFSNVAAIATFQIPFDLDAEMTTDEQDWIPAELDESALNIPVEPAHTINNNLNHPSSTLESSTTGTMSELATHTQPEKEQWGVFDPNDALVEEEEQQQQEQPPQQEQTATTTEGKEEDRNNREDDSTVSSIEKTRAVNNESMTSDPKLLRASVLNDDTGSLQSRSIQGPIPEDNGDGDGGGFPLDDDGPMMMDEDEAAAEVVEPPSFQSIEADDDETKQRQSLHLSISHDESTTNKAAISLGGEEVDESSVEEQESSKKKKKRKSTDTQQSNKARRSKRRKILMDTNGQTELTSEQIRQALADPSSCIIDPIHPATWVNNGMKETEENTNTQLLLHHLSHEALFVRPSHGDDGDFNPYLLLLWKRNCAAVQNQPLNYVMATDDDDQEETVEKEKGEEEKDQVEEESKAEEEETKQDEEPEEALRQQVEEQADDEEEMPFPAQDDDEDEEQFPDGDGGAMFAEEDEPPPMIMEEDAIEPPALVDSPAVHSLKSLESTFSLGATNGVDDEELDRDETETSTTKWHKNTIKVFGVLKNNMSPADGEITSMSFEQMSKGVTRRTAAGVFFELLQLKTLNYIELNQDESFGDINISPGVKFMEDPPVN